MFSRQRMDFFSTSDDFSCNRSDCFSSRHLHFSIRQKIFSLGLLIRDDFFSTSATNGFKENFSAKKKAFFSIFYVTIIRLAWIFSSCAELVQNEHFPKIFLELGNQLSQKKGQKMMTTQSNQFPGNFLDEAKNWGTWWGLIFHSMYLRILSSTSHVGDIHH